MVLCIISSDTFFWSALGSCIVIPNLYVIQKWNYLSSYFHAPSFPGPKPVTIGKDLGVTYCYMYFAFPLHPLMTINQSKPISCPVSWMLQCCYYLQIGCLCLLSMQKCFVAFHKNRYKTTTLAILKNGPNMDYSIWLKVSNLVD
jgi:hypothetical protein